MDLLGNSAHLSDCGVYRYRLERYVGAGTKTIVFFGVNPSTADAEVDDNTVMRWKGFATRLKARRFIVGNVFSYRATDVRELATAEDPFGPEHWDVQKEIIKEADLLIPCWGSRMKLPANLRPYPEGLMGKLTGFNAETNVPLMSWGLTASRDPKHPLMLPYDTPLEPL